MRMWRTLHCPRHGELSSSWWLLCVDSGQGSIGSQLLNSCFVYVVATPREPLASRAGNRNQYLAQDQG